MSLLITLLCALPFFFSTETDPITPLHIASVQVDSFESILIQREKNVQRNYSQHYSKKNAGVSKFEKFNTQVAKKIKIVDINTADSADFEKLPGIGEKLSARIVKYRERLGGYVVIEQLKEIYGMQDSNFLKFKPWVKVDELFIPHKIVLNKASYEDLRKHPYLSNLFARSVLAYIKMHGSINNAEELNSIGSINKDEILKVLPYLDFRL